MGTVHTFDPRPPPFPKPTPDAPFFVGLAWGLAVTTLFWGGLFVFARCTIAVFGASSPS